MLIGYVRVSKSDGSQTLAPQRDAMLQAGVAPERIYQDLASGRLLRGDLDPRRSQELMDEMRAAGLPT